MKKILCFIPTTVVFVLLVFVLIILVGPTNQLSDYLIGIAILLIFLISDWFLSKPKWYGCILGTLLGAYVIYYGSGYHGQVFDERPIGILICAYYLICGVVTYRKQKNEKSQTI